MGAGHHRPLVVAGDSYLHRMAPEAKIAATVLFVFAVVATPKEAFWAFGVYGTVIVTLAAVVGLRPGSLARRLTLELPFLGFAFLLPFVGSGEQVDVLGLSLSVDGLWGAWNILVKGTIGVAAAALLVATTDTPALLQGLGRLRVPTVLVAIASFMIRYLELVAGELRAMRIARESRGSDPRWLWQARAVAATAGTLFVRSYERGERVYLAMLSRGYAGSMPELSAAGSARWSVALLLPAGATAVAVAAWVTR
jgi:cobalt/nickel transport system permease protein